MFSYTPAATSAPSHHVLLANGEILREPTKEKEIKEERKGKVSLEQLFNYGRIKQQAPLINKLLFLLYLPLGLIVLAVRVVMFVVLALSIIILPRTCDFFTMPMMKVVCGLWVRHNNKNRGTPLLNEPHIVAANHITDFDTFAMWTVLPKFHTLTGGHLKDIPLVGRAYAKLNAIFVTQTPEGRAEVKQKIHDVLQVDPAPVLIFPEGGLTNGRAGAMMYHRFVFSLDTSVIPTAIALNDPWPIYHDYLGSSYPRNLLWFLFVPFHIFDVTLLPVERREGGETPEEFAGRVQRITCEFLKIEPTHFAYSQKKELWKQIASGKKKVL